jgi:hypothetical protein
MTLYEYLRQICNWCELPFQGEPVFHEWDTDEAFSFCSEGCRDLMAEFIERISPTTPRSPGIDKGDTSRLAALCASRDA